MMHPLDLDEFHSPIVSSARNVIINNDNLKFSLMPEMSSKGSFESKQQRISNQLENEIEMRSSSNRCPHRYRNMNEIEIYNYNGKNTLHSVSFEESIAHRPSSDKNGNITIIDDIISEFKDSDIMLMQEALSGFMNDNEVNIFSGNPSDCHREHNAVKNHLTRECSDLNIFPARSCKQNYHVNREVNHLLITEEFQNNIDDVEIEDFMDRHAQLLPQVTFDEEEESSDVNLIEKQEALSHCSKPGSGDPIVSSRLYNDPSQWLLEQLAFERLSVEYHIGDTSIGSAPKTKKDVRANIGGIRASKETKHKHWSEEEDEMLRLAIANEKANSIDWIRLARKYFNNTRSATQCKNRWKNYLKPGVIRGNWQKHEDEFILSMVSRGLKWVDIAKGLPGRTGEHVRERYVNVLDCNLKKTCWTAEEDRILFQHQRILGNKWSEIRKLLPGRSDNSIKNRFHNRRNAHIRRLKRESLEKKRCASLIS